MPNSVEKFKKYPGIKAVIRNISNIPENGAYSVFPHNVDWNRDNYGPIYIPEKGKTVALTLESLPFYQRIITSYEKDDNGNPNELKVTGNEIRLNGKVVNSYTFKQNYYWMMGDNRHNSEDSRYWGYVPEDHIVGKPVFTAYLQS